MEDCKRLTVCLPVSLLSIRLTGEERRDMVEAIGEAVLKLAQARIREGGAL